MNYLAPGLRELARISARQRHRLRMVVVRRDLKKAETALGLLGWQQAEFDPQTQAEVDKINAYEREQARLTNESAGLGKELRELREAREAGRKEFAEQRRELVARRAALLEGHPRIEKELAERRKIEPALERRMPELERETREINKLYTELLAAHSQTPQTKQELIRLRERTVTIPNEKADLRNQHLRTVSEIRSLEAQLGRDRATLAALDQQQQDLQTHFDATDGHLASEIRAREREKVRIEREINLIEGAKSNPYLQVGRVLADNDIAPMNQPAALDKVKRLRGKLVECEHVIRLSRDASALEDRQFVHLSWLLWSMLALVGMLLLLAALPRR